METSDKNENKNSNHEKRGKQNKHVHEPDKKGRIIIRNLSFKLKEEQLVNEFKKFGEINEVNILKKPDGKLVGCAFIQYANGKGSLKAIKAMNGKDFLSRKITVQESLSKDRFLQSKGIKPSAGNELKEEIKEEEIKEEPVEVKEAATESGSENDEDDEEEEPDSEGLDEESDEEHKETKDDIKKPNRSNVNDHEFTVFLKNLSYDTTNEDLEECFKKFGPIKYALVVRNPVSGHSKGSGFVRFLKKESVNLCLQQTGLIMLQNYTIEVFPSLPKQKIQELESDKKKQEPKDTRNLYLLREGMIMAGSSAAEGVSATDMSNRLRLEQVKSSMLKNLNRFISRDRLTIHNLLENFDDDKLRKMVVARTGLKPIECRVMRENKPSAAHPKGKPKGFGFLSFKRHEDALAVLRKLNNNPDAFSANHRPIVSFSIEDKNVLNIKERREKRSLLNNPTYQKKLEKLKLKKAKKAQDKKDKKPAMTAANSKTVVTKSKVEENEEQFSGFAAKPGPFMKLRGTFKLKQQSKIHEKATNERKKVMRREKGIAEIKQERKEKKSDRQTSKRKLETTDNLSKMIDKYKNLIKGDGPDNKKPKTRGKWFID